MQQAGYVSGLELDQKVDVAVRAEVVAEGGAEQCEALDAMAAGEHGEEVSSRDRPGRSCTRSSCRTGEL
jgi:hypothetical protein